MCELGSVPALPGGATGAWFDISDVVSIAVQTDAAITLAGSWEPLAQRTCLRADASSQAGVAVRAADVRAKFPTASRSVGVVTSRQLRRSLSVQTARADICIVDDVARETHIFPPCGDFKAETNKYP